MDLVIVESPAKAKTINGYLGSGYRVLASFGHVRDLEAKDGAVDPEHDFAMRWLPSADRAKQLKEIAEAAKGADRVILATDPDREGEAISWHLYEWLKAKKALPAKTERVTFNAITKPSVLAAMAAPRALDQPLIDAYRARRALDYLVGFTLSPVLWRKLPGAKSAGRVQSVALRLIVDREREIEAFRAVEYWSVVATVAREGLNFPARLVQWRGAKLDRLSIGTMGEADAAKADVEASAFAVESVERKPGQRQPAPPFTTSTLQQEAARKLGFTAQHTMRLAQSLYEAGAITYMRTDGVQMAAEAIAGARSEVGRLEREWARQSDFGADNSYLPPKPRVYTAKAKNAQEAHEAVRPTDFAMREAGSGDEAKLYQLIWRRALASQMANAQLERTVIEFAEPTAQHRLRATGQVIVFPGFLRLYEEGRDEAADEEDGRLPSMAVGETPAIQQVDAEQHFTQPPPRFGEASLVKRMEELGIGRPSTYASILQVLRDRNYVRMEAKRFLPEDSGRLVTAFLERYFDRYVSYDYTAGLEERLDEVSAGTADYVQVLREFWEAFRPAADEVMAILPSEVTAALDQFLGDYLFPPKADGSDPRLCPLCAIGQLHLKGGKSGAFVGCDRYPECRYTRPFAGAGGVDGAPSGPEELGVDPDTGELITRRTGRFGPFVQRGDGGEDGKPPRVSIPKDVPEIDLAMALRLLALPRTVGTHPETGEPIKASIGRYGPYLSHNGKYAKLQTTEDVLQIGMNLAVAALADAAERGPRKGVEPLRIVGADPASGANIKLMQGKYGPYVTNGVTNASLAKGADPAALTLDEAVTLLVARAEAAPAKGKRKAAAKAKAKAGGKSDAVKKPAKAKPAKAKPPRKAPAKSAATI